MRTLFRISVTVMLTMLVIIILWRFQAVLGTFIIALLITASLRPLVDWMRQFRIPAGVSMLLFYAAAIGLVVGAAIWLFPTVSAEIQFTLTDINSMYADYYDRLTASGSLSETATASLPPPATFPTMLPGVTRQEVISLIAGTTVTAIDGISQLFLIIIMSIYLAVDRVRFERLWLSVFNPARRTLARQIYHEIEDNIGAYLRSELAQTVVAIFVLYAAYLLIGLKFPLLSAILVGATWFIPLVGGLLGLVWIAFAGAMTSVPVMLMALAITGALMAFLEFWLQPRLYTRDRFGTILVLVMMMILARAFGLVGLLIAPPLATAAQTLINTLLRVPGSREAQIAEQQDLPAAAAIQDEWQELNQRLAELRASVQEDEAPQSTAHLLERLADLVEKTRAELEAGTSGTPVPVTEKNP